MLRANTLLLHPSQEQGKTLILLSEASSRLWNRANYQRRQAFFSHSTRPTYAFQSNHFKDNTDYKLLGTCKSQALLQKLDEAWRATFALLKLRRTDKLPQDIKRIGIPHYWKDRKTKKLEPKGIYVRNDGYWMDEKVLRISKETKIPFTSGVQWVGKQGRLEIQSINNRWYAHQPVEFAEPRIQQSSEPRKIASIDLGACNLVTLVMDKQPLIYSARSVLSDWIHWTKRIAKIQSTLKTVNSKHSSKKLVTLFRRRKRHLRHAINALLRDLFERLEEARVTKLILGDLTGIRENAHYSKKVNQKIHNYWSNAFTVDRIRELGEEYGIEIILVNEAYSSKRCSLCGKIHPISRLNRVMYNCPAKHRYINADVNGSLNIADASPHQEKELAVAGSMAEPLLLKWDKCGWKSKSSVSIQDRKNTIEAQTTKIPILVEIPGNGIL